MPANPISTTLFTAASLSAGLRRAATRLTGKPVDQIADPYASALSTARHRARLLHIPQSAIAEHVATARTRGQTELSALNDLLARTSPGSQPRHR
jgi:hypothetical protein